MPDDGVWAPGHQATAGSHEAEGAAQRDKRHDADGETGQMQAKPGDNSPVRMGADGPEQDASECTAERQQPAPTRA
jgi:hypothetical protein